MKSFDTLVFGSGRIGSRLLKILGETTACRQRHVADIAPEAPPGVTSFRANAARLEEIHQTLKAFLETEPLRPVVFSALPPSPAASLAGACLEHGIPFISSNFKSEAYRALAQPARERGVPIVCEAGLDPGLDRILLRDLLKNFKSVEAVRIFGGGLPASPKGIPLGYAFTWYPEGVLAACRRPADILEDGTPRPVSGNRIMSPEHVFSRTIGEETFLAYPNGEASRLAEALQAPESPTAKTCAHLKEARTCSLRHPAFITFMRAAGRNGLLREEGRVADLPAPADLSEAEAALFEELNLPAALKQAGEEAPDTAPQTFLAEHLKKHLTLPPGRADRVIIRVEVKGQTVTGPIEGIATLTREGTVETSAMADTVARPMAVIGPYLRAENIPPGVHTPLSLPAPAGDPRRVLAETGYKFSRDFKSVTFREVTSAL